MWEAVIAGFKPSAFRYFDKNNDTVWKKDEWDGAIAEIAENDPTYLQRKYIEKGEKIDEHGWDMVPDSDDD